jgi:hypothetical protein
LPVRYLLDVELDRVEYRFAQSVRPRPERRRRHAAHEAARDIEGQLDALMVYLQRPVAAPHRLVARQRERPPVRQLRLHSQPAAGQQAPVIECALVFRHRPASVAAERSIGTLGPPVHATRYVLSAVNAPRRLAE